MLLYVVMAFWAAIGWAFNARLASIVARAIAPTGAMFTFLALWTGALWGKPTWGTWWVWDARLTSELILLFLYAGYIALVSAIDDTRRADRAGALLADRRQRQRADHLFLGDLVEHAAPRGKRQRHRSAQNGERDAAGDAADDARVLGLRLRGHLRPHQGHRPGTRQSRGVGASTRSRAPPRAKEQARELEQRRRLLRHGRLRHLRLGRLRGHARLHGGRAGAGACCATGARAASSAEAPR